MVCHVRVHHDAVGASEILKPAFHHRGGAADQRGVVEADDVAGLEIAVVEPGLQDAFVKRDGPVHALDPADAQQLRVLDRLDVINELDFGVHHPDVGEARVGDEAVGAGHEAHEDGHLLGDEERGDGEAEEDAEVLAPVAGEHLERDVDHRRAAFLRGEEKPRMPSREKATM